MSDPDCPLCSSQGREYLRTPASERGPGRWGVEIPICAIHWQLVLSTVLDAIDAQDRSTAPCVLPSGVREKRSA
jgi:hypothetical protein